MRSLLLLVTVILIPYLVIINDKRLPIVIYYLPLYYQVLGASAIGAGIRQALIPSFLSSPTDRPFQAVTLLNWRVNDGRAWRVIHHLIRQIPSYNLDSMGNLYVGVWSDDHAGQYIQQVNSLSRFYWKVALNFSLRAEKELYPFVAAVGFGALFQVCSFHVSRLHSHLVVGSTHCIASSNAY